MQAVNIFGAWLGIDFYSAIRGSHALLSRRSDETEEKFQGREQVLGGAETSPSASSPASSVEIIDDWDDGILVKAIRDSKHGDELNFFSTYYPVPEFGKLEVAIRDLHEKLVVPSDGSPLLKIRIMFLHFNARHIIKSRFKLFVSPPDFRTLAIHEARTFCNLKEGFLNKITNLKQRLSDKIALEVKFYKSWPFGHYFKIGKRVTFFAPLLPVDQALAGPMMIFHNSGSKMWQALEKSFNDTFAAITTTAEQDLKGASKKVRRKRRP